MKTVEYEYANCFNKKVQVGVYFGVDSDFIIDGNFRIASQRQQYFYN
jgi:hypothetical protein